MYRRNDRRQRRNFEKPSKGLQVIVRDGDVNQALRVFKNKVKRAGVIQECKRRQYYTKPSEQRQINKKRAIKRWQKYLKKREQMYGY